MNYFHRKLGFTTALLTNNFHFTDANKADTWGKMTFVEHKHLFDVVRGISLVIVNTDYEPNNNKDIETNPNTHHFTPCVLKTSCCCVAVYSKTIQMLLFMESAHYVL